MVGKYGVRIDGLGYFPCLFNLCLFAQGEHDALNQPSPKGTQTACPKLKEVLGGME
jgi:hypothetical protein